MTTGTGNDNDADEFERLLNGYAEEPGGPDSPTSPGSDATAAAPTPGADAKRALYQRVLEEEGYRFTVDEDGDFSLRREGKWLVLFVDDDPVYFRLSAPNLFECKSEAQVDLALVVANEMNRAYKVVKFVVVDGWVWGNVEMYLQPLDVFRATFDRCADLLCETASEFCRRMRRTSEKPRPVSAPSPHEPS